MTMLLGAADDDSWLETVAILSDPDARAAIAAGLEELRAAKTRSVDEVRVSMVRAGRCPE
jgi:PHD/YefM family antitoxin component YafN of YafNO toxin-antitoxin module